METKSYKSVNVEKNWHLVDAEDKVLGRLAVKIANILSGKNKAQYSPNADLGDFVVVVNAEKVKVTGNKFTQKNYYHHTGYPGGLKTKSFEKMQEDSPEKIIEKAVKGMLPKNKLANQIIKKLKVYSGSAHPHIGQQPKELSI
ncbi:MAG: 50S ribosomal protein L13 [SAR86 cluster bacterium]|uniref:Large ribosomal subunit protein uL13 n=1 Tax=SAR86 cluster bacterium TaxID=2030880 RepID=A0A937LDY9_9GAMM|nr:50S ribosomal protein L13 [SAR86 cluster bacterium]